MAGSINKQTIVEGSFEFRNGKVITYENGKLKYSGELEGLLSENITELKQFTIWLNKLTNAIPEFYHRFHD